MSVKKYSKGMLQRLGLVQAMLHDPDLLILDEPTDGVDPVGRAEMREILARLKGQGKSIFLNSHMLQEVELVCDRVAILHKGKLRHVGDVADITALRERETVFRLEGAGGNHPQDGRRDGCVFPGVRPARIDFKSDSASPCNRTSTVRSISCDKRESVFAG